MRPFELMNREGSIFLYAGYVMFLFGKRLLVREHISVLIYDGMVDLRIVYGRMFDLRRATKVGDQKVSVCALSLLIDLSARLVKSLSADC